MFPTNNIKPRFAALLAGVALLASPASAATYSAFATVCSATQNQPASTQFASVAINNEVCFNSSIGGAAARADSGGIGVGVDFYSNGLGTLAQARGQVNTTFVVNGPGTDPIPVSINFVLSGTLGGGTSPNSVSYRQIENRVTVLAYNYSGGAQVSQSYGSATQTWNSSLDPGLSYRFAGALAPTGDCLEASRCQIQSPLIYVYPGAVNELELWAQATVDSAMGVGYGYASFLNTFYFPTNGPVFNLPDGYSLTLEGLNVVNNRVVANDGGAVPEPATCSLVGAALAAAILLRRR